MALYLNGNKISNSMVVNGAIQNNPINISDFSFSNKINTTVPTVTKISDYEFALSFQDQSSSGYEQCLFKVTLPAGTYIAEIKATVDKNTGLAGGFTWGIYTSSSNSNITSDAINAYSTYVPFIRTDTNEHTYYVPIVVRADGYAYICFAMADDNGVNATVTVSSLKIYEGVSVVSSGGNATKVALNNWISGIYIDKTNGQEVSYSTWSATDYIKIFGTKLTVVGLSAEGSDNSGYNAFYDNNKNFISNFSFGGYEIAIPSNARYIRLSARTTYISNNATLYYDSGSGTI